MVPFEALQQLDVHLHSWNCKSIYSLQFGKCIEIFLLIMTMNITNPEYLLRHQISQNWLSKIGSPQSKIERAEFEVLDCTPVDLPSRFQII
jgi:hypothetical protein